MGDGLIDTLINLVLCALVVLSALGYGRLALRSFGFRHGSDWEAVILSIGVGLAWLVYALVILGMWGLLYPVAGWALMVGGLVAVRGGWRQGDTLRLRGALSSFLPWNRVTMAMAFLLLIQVVFYGVAALSPTLEGDSLSNYMVVAREYAVRHALERVDNTIVSSFPQNGEMLSTLGFLLRGQILAQLLVSFGAGLLCVFVIYALGQSYFSRTAAVVGTALWYGTYSVGYLNASAKIDLAWAAFDLMGIFAFSRWYFAERNGRDWRWLALAGFFLGVAGGVKQASVFTGAALSLGIIVGLVQARERQARTWTTAFLAFGLPASLASLWVVRTYLMTGMLAYTGEGLPRDHGVLGLLRTLWGMSMLGNGVGAEGPLGKPVGPTLLATLPLLVLLRRVDRRIWHMLAFSATTILLWYQSVPRARHLLPTLALLALVAGYVVVRLLVERPRLGRFALGAALLALVSNLAFWTYVNLVSVQRIPYVVGVQDRDRYLAENLPKWPWYPNHAIVSYAHQYLPADARIAALSSGNSYYLERPLYTDWAATPADYPDPGEFVTRLREARITHVFANEYVMGIRKLQDAWLARAEFQAAYLRPLVCADGQCLYALK